MTSPQHGRNVKLEKLPCKSPRFHAYFRKKSIFSSNYAFFGYGPQKEMCLSRKTAPEKCPSLSLESFWSRQEAPEQEQDLKIQVIFTDI